MLKVNKVSEYGVLALGFISQKHEPQSATEVATGLNVPYEITAKTLQKLKEAGFLTSTKGINGGYKLSQSLSDISIGQVIDAFEGPLSIVDCNSTEKHKECVRQSCCEIKTGMEKVNQKVREVLSSMKLNELLATSSLPKESAVK
jgi:Rrf2 family protein